MTMTTIQDVHNFIKDANIIIYGRAKLRGATTIDDGLNDVKCSISRLRATSDAHTRLKRELRFRWGVMSVIIVALGLVSFYEFIYIIKMGS